MFSSLTKRVIISIKQRSYYIDESCKAVVLTVEDELQAF